MEKIKFHISYKDHREKDIFLRGKNIIEDEIEDAIREFYDTYPKKHCEIIGVLKTVVDGTHNI